MGDQIIATGLARGAKDKRIRIAFGEGDRIRWDTRSEIVFQDNPNIARPGEENASDLFWIPYYKGNRQYNSHDRARNRFVWNYEFKCKPGEIYFKGHEESIGQRYGKGFVVIEPNVPLRKSWAMNKTWPRERYQQVVDWLRERHVRPIQPIYPDAPIILDRVEKAKTHSFRDMLAILRNAALYIGPEGGLHHGAAALGIPAIVLFGGFIPQAVTGYDCHTNLTGGAEACGSLSRCDHCMQAMARIPVEEVYCAAEKYLG